MHCISKTAVCYPQLATVIGRSNLRITTVGSLILWGRCCQWLSVGIFLLLAFEDATTTCKAVKAVLS